MSQLVPQNNITDLIKSQMPAIALVMNGVSEKDRKNKAERFARICLTAVRNNSKLMGCTQESFAAALMTCAQLNLEPNTPQGLAYLIPYGKECQFQIGYKGLLQLVYRSGIIASFNADVVYKNEIEQGLFEYRKGITPTITHKVDLLQPEAREGELIAAYAACTFKGGGEGMLRLVDKKDIERAQKTSASFTANKKYGKDSPWISSPEAMWMKTAIKRLVSWLPQTEMLAMAVDLDDKAERGESQLVLPELTPTEGLNAALTGNTPEAQPDNLVTCPKTEAQVNDWTCSDCEQRAGCPAWAE